MKSAIIQNGERVKVTKQNRDLGHGKQVLVIYSDKTKGWEHVEDLQTHGGSRKGAGRPITKEPTFIMRIPVSKVEAVKKLVAKKQNRNRKNNSRDLE